MKRIITIASMLCVFIGCAGAPHTVEHAQNAIVGAGYQAAVELCVQAALKEIDQGVEKPKIQAEYDACADAADKQFGRKP